VAPDHGINTESVKAVEQYVISERWGYAGQLDLAYTAPDGATVVADLKTSSFRSEDEDVRIGYQLQQAAYAYAAPFEVDRLMLIQLDVKSNQWRVVTSESDKYDASIGVLQSEFLGLAERANQAKLSEWTDGT
jgi:hypothetical protein